MSVALSCELLAPSRMPVLGQPEVYLQAGDQLFTADGGIGESSREFLQGWMDRYLAWVRRFGPQVQAGAPAG